MDGRWRTLVLVILVATLFSIAGQCVRAVDGQGTSSPGLTSAGVVFLEHNLIANGTVVNGTVPFRSVNFPSYWFNENTRQLNGDIGFALDDSLVMIFGDALTLKGNFGAGTGNKLFGIYSLPARADNAVIYSADRYGTVSMFVNNRTVILRAGQTYSYNETEVLKEGKGIVRVVYQHQYTNHGLIDRNAILSRMVPAV
ncbi:MAG: hypothetical protein A4E28_02677 [Methanocella sp. PtaU1.Bin125]|nr:MAG: hypothetical protein A4E28_02677 [Methanocella sp. PtaU1.Bin125]